MKLDPGVNAILAIGPWGSQSWCQITGSGERGWLHNTVGYGVHGVLKLALFCSEIVVVASCVCTLVGETDLKASAGSLEDSAGTCPLMGRTESWSYGGQGHV